MGRKKNTERVFNPLKRKVLRRRFSRAELIFGPVFLLLLLLTGAWILAQKNRFDPRERDIDYTLLQEGSVQDTLYHPPLRRWVEPGTAGSGTPQVDLGVLPPSILAGGWRLDGRLETFNPSNLYEKIDGAAEQYLAFGFVELNYLSVTRENDFITIELYDQGSFPNVLGLFSAQGGGTHEVEHDGDIFFYRTPVGAIGGVGNYYFKISASTDAPLVVEKAMAIVGEMTGLPLDAGSVPLPYQALTARLGVPFGQVSYEKENAFQYDFLQEFWFAPAGAMNGPKKPSEARIFLHQAESEEAATSEFTQLVEEQSFEYQVLKNETAEAVFKHEYLKTIFSVRRDGRLIYGVDGAADRTEAESLMNRIRKAVSNG